MSTGEESKTHEVDAMTAIKAVGDMLTAEIRENQRLEAENQQLREAISDLLMSARLCWEERNEGHDIRQYQLENQRLRNLLTLFLEASTACDTSICGLAIDRIKDELKEDTP
jgi:regulator of replication initiation timing